MDRFIEKPRAETSVQPQALKSNMDRFIVEDFEDDKHRDFPLKSNMDRFIAVVENLNKGE